MNEGVNFCVSIVVVKKIELHWVKKVSLLRQQQIFFPLIVQQVIAIHLLTLHSVPFYIVHF